MKVLGLRVDEMICFSVANSIALAPLGLDFNNNSVPPLQALVTLSSHS